MDIDLQHAFEDLATDVRPTGVSPDDLWRRGVRRRNRRRAVSASAVVTAIALVAGLVGLASTPGLLTSDRTTPAGTTADARLPDRVWMPSPWTPGTDEAGHPGRIGVLFWDNGHRLALGGSGSGAFVSVSALDGKYRYLDLPGLVSASQSPVLSPDGRYLAYPVRSGAPDDPTTVTTGWVVYDAQTGRTARHVPDGVPQGVGQSTLVWTPDSSTLLMDVCRVTEVTPASQSCETRRTDVWEVAADRTWSITGVLAQEVAGRAGESLLVRGAADGSLAALDERTGEVRDVGRVQVRGESVVVAALTPSGGVVVTGGDEGGGPLRFGEVALERDGTLSGPVRSASSWTGSTEGITGLLADGAVVTVDGGTGRDVVLRQPSGASRPLVQVPAGFAGAELRVPTDLAGEPTTPGVAPPDIRDPRAVTGAVALGLAVVAAAGLLWRRRRELGDVTA